MFWEVIEFWFLWRSAVALPKLRCNAEFSNAVDCWQNLGKVLRAGAVAQKYI